MAWFNGHRLRIFLTARLGMECWLLRLLAPLILRLSALQRKWWMPSWSMYSVVVGQLVYDIPPVEVCNIPITLWNLRNLWHRRCLLVRWLSYFMTILCAPMLPLLFFRQAEVQMLLSGITHAKYCWQIPKADPSHGWNLPWAFFCQWLWAQQVFDILVCEIMPFCVWLFAHQPNRHVDYKGDEILVGQCALIHLPGAVIRRGHGDFGICFSRGRGRRNRG